jgi:molecular chaperone GrpE
MTKEKKTVENEVVEETKSTTEQLEQECAKLKDQLLRALADAENTRKRAQKEREDASKYAASGLARDILGVSDNLKRALENVSEEQEKSLSPEMKSLLDGIKLTEKELIAAFEKHGIQQVHPKGEPFNHDLHQAMFEVETDEHTPGTVIEVLQTGYVIKDRLLRPAMVGVSKAPAKK